MDNGSNIEKLVSNFKGLAQRQVKVQTVWVTVKTVDWDKKNMTATGVTDELDYIDVLLGLGGNYRKPTVGSYCLIGMIENQDGAAFLIDCETEDEYSLNAGQTLFKSDGDKFTVEASGESLGKCLDDLVQEILNIYAPKNVAKIGLIKGRLKKILDNGIG